MSNPDKLLAMTLGATERLGAPRPDGVTHFEALETEVDNTVDEIVRIRRRCYARTPAGARDQFPTLVKAAIAELLKRITEAGL